MYYVNYGNTAKKNAIAKIILTYFVRRNAEIRSITPGSIVTDNGTQTVNISCDHEEENNCRVMNELKVFRQHLLDYNKRTFEKFMQDIEREYRERVTANKRLRCEVENMKMQVQEAEKKLASIKSDSIH